MQVTDQALEEEIKRHHKYPYPEMTKTLGNFKLKVQPGYFSDSEIIVMLGENGTGKSTMIKLLADPDFDRKLFNSRDTQSIFDLFRREAFKP